MSRKTMKKLNNLDFLTPKPLPPPDKNLYRRKGNKDLPLPAKLPPPIYPQITKKSNSLPSTYKYSSLLPTYRYTNNNTNSGLLTTDIFPTHDSITKFKSKSLSQLPKQLSKRLSKRLSTRLPSPSPSPIFLPVIKKSKNGKLSKRCPRGTRRNKKTNVCEKNKYYMRKRYTKRHFKRCPNGKNRNPITLKCEPKTLFTRYRI